MTLSVENYRLDLVIAKFDPFASFKSNHWWFDLVYRLWYCVFSFGVDGFFYIFFGLELDQVMRQIPDWSSCSVCAMALTRYAESCSTTTTST